MPRADQLLALLQSHVDGDLERFRSVALQIAAHEARQGHSRLAVEMRELIDEAELRQSVVDRRGPTNIAQARGELANLVSISYPEIRLDSMVLSEDFRERLKRVILEQRQSDKLGKFGLTPRKKLLLVGPPGAGKTMTASAIAGELNLPLFAILLEGVITKYLGETAAKIRTIFDAMARTRAVFLFDEFDAIGAKRSSSNDVGEVRRILNSFLQLLEHDTSASIIICATNHPELLDRALFRRFDDVLEYRLPDDSIIREIIRTRLRHMPVGQIDWDAVSEAARGLSQADLARACEEATKFAVLAQIRIETQALLAAIQERRDAGATRPGFSGHGL